MRILRFIVTAQSIQKAPDCDFSGIVAGTQGYLRAEFSFSAEWAGCRVAAVFSRLGKEYAEPVLSGGCKIPSEALTWDSFGVRVVGQRAGYRITTNEIKVRQERR